MVLVNHVAMLSSWRSSSPFTIFDHKPSIFASQYQNKHTHYGLRYNILFIPSYLPRSFRRYTRSMLRKRYSTSTLPHSTSSHTFRTYRRRPVQFSSRGMLPLSLQDGNLPALLWCNFHSWPPHHKHQIFHQESFTTEYHRTLYALH